MSFSLASRMRDFVELLAGYAAIIAVIWSPERLQRIFSPLVLAVTLGIILWHRPDRDELGLGYRGLVPALWILPVGMIVAGIAVVVATKLGTLHPLYHGSLRHVAGYILWTVYQQILLQDLFMPRLLHLLPAEIYAVCIAGAMFASAHLPNLVLAAATLIWGITSCAAFRRYHNLWVLGLTQGLLGLCFAVCVPDTLSHHLRVGLGYLHHHS